MTDSIKKEQTFNHSIDTVWKAISIGEEISSWFLQADFKPEAGYHYTFKKIGDDCPPISGEVIEANPYKLVYTWVVNGMPTITTVTWQLEVLNGQTRLSLEHSGISKFEGETAVEMFNSFNGGWDNCLQGLTSYLKDAVHAG